MSRQADASHDEIEHVMGSRPDGCPWWAFKDHDVSETLRAHDWHPNCAEYYGPDPEWWIVEAVTHFHRELQRARVSAIKTESIRKRAQAPQLPSGMEVVDVIRG